MSKNIEMFLLLLKKRQCKTDMSQIELIKVHLVVKGVLTRI